MEVLPTALRASREQEAAVDAAYRDYQARSYFSSLDGFRCFCIAAVIWHHFGPRWRSLPGSTRGFLGVDMFFVISGFLIVTLLLRERDRTGEVSLRAFYMRRTLRIFPPYYAMLLIFTAASLSVFAGSHYSTQFLGELPYYLTYTSNWVFVDALPLTWSLATEEQFYLVWPAVEKYFRRFALPILALVVALSQWMNFGRGNALFDALLGREHGELSILEATFTPICFGAAMAHLLNSRRGFRAFTARLGGRTAPLALLALTLLLANIPNKDISGLHRLGLHVAMAALLGACVVTEEHSLTRLLTWPVIRRIGVVSYGMYLFHLIARHVIHVAAPKVGLHDEVLKFVLGFALTWLIAELSFRLFEAHFLRLKERFSPLHGARHSPS